jgi:hypothetical protein
MEYKRGPSNRSFCQENAQSSQIIKCPAKLSVQIRLEMRVYHYVSHFKFLSFTLFDFGTCVDHLDTPQYAQQESQTKYGQTLQPMRGEHVISRLDDLARILIVLGGHPDTIDPHPHQKTHHFFCFSSCMHCIINSPGYLIDRPDFPSAGTCGGATFENNLQC